MNMGGGNRDDIISPWENLTFRKLDTEGIPSSIFALFDKNWSDPVLKTFPGMVLHLLDDHTVVQLGIHCYGRLSSGASDRVVAMIVQLAWNLRDTRTRKHVFAGPNETTTDNDVPYEVIRDDVHKTWGEFQLVETRGNESELACGFAYISASLLRLATKDIESYRRQFPRIKESFQNFYGFAFPTPNLELSSNALTYIHAALTQHSSIRNSLKSFVWCHDVNKCDIALRRYLYEQHLSYAGIPVYSFFTKTLEFLGCTREKYMEALMNGNTKIALEEIDRIWKTFENTNHPDLIRKTWMFARIFSPDYFSDLQTKNCIPLVTILAEIQDICNTQVGDNSKATNLFHIKNLSPSAREYYRGVAGRIYNHVTTKALLEGIIY